METIKWLGLIVIGLLWGMIVGTPGFAATFFAPYLEVAKEAKALDPKGADNWFALRMSSGEARSFILGSSSAATVLPNRLAFSFGGAVPLFYLDDDGNVGIIGPLFTEGGILYRVDEQLELHGFFSGAISVLNARVNNNDGTTGLNIWDTSGYLQYRFGGENFPLFMRLGYSNMVTGSASKSGNTTQSAIYHRNYYIVDFGWKREHWKLLGGDFFPKDTMVSVGVRVPKAGNSVSFFLQQSFKK